MWIEKEVTLDKKKVDAKVNLGSDQSEVELPFFENWDDLGVIKIGNDKWAISSATNVGGRDETILMTVKKEKNDVYKSDKSRKDT
jgi:hypothetical protein